MMDSSHRFGPDSCTAIGKIVTIYGSDNHMFKLKMLNGLRNLIRFLFVNGQRFSGCCGTKFTTAGTYITQDHKCGSTGIPAFAHIGAFTARTNGVQIILFKYSFNMQVVVAFWKFYFKPFRFTDWQVGIRIHQKKLIGKSTFFRASANFIHEIGNLLLPDLDIIVLLKPEKEAE
jgi:hypothetical protein